MSATPKYKVVVGRAEPVDFVDFDLSKVPAKVDTGAYHSAVHASNIELSKDGKSLSFDLLTGHPNFEGTGPRVTLKEFRLVEVENSFGVKQQRYEVKLRVLLGHKSFKTKFTLADRSVKDYPILLGRTLLNNRFVVDTAETRVDRVALKQNLKKHQEQSS